MENNYLSNKVIYKYENILLCVFSFLAALSAFGLLQSELVHLGNKDKALGCDLNPLIGCGSSLSSWHSHLLFGISNSIVGLVIFTILFTIFVLCLFKVQLPSIIWNVCFAGSFLGFLWVLWFLWISVFTFKKLCPFCLVIWFSTILIFVILLAIVSRNAFIISNKTINAFFATYRFYIALIIFLSILVFLLFGMMDVWVQVFK